jgi:hypothetical protein
MSLDLTYLFTVLVVSFIAGFGWRVGTWLAEKIFS